MGSSSKKVIAQLLHSFTLKLALLAVILLSVPLILYWQFARAEQEQLALISNAVVQSNHVLAGMLQGHFERFASEPPGVLRQALARAAVGDTHIKILVRLKDTKDFVYVASQPVVASKYLRAERDELVRLGIFDLLGPSCDGDTDLDMRFINPSGGREVLGAMTPVHVEGNCWLVITSQDAARLARTPIGLPFWKAPTALVSGSIYLIATALVIWLFMHLWRNVRRFRQAARHIRMRDRGAVSFRRTNTIPELTGVAEDFDSLVGALLGSQQRIREAAEENSHALKTPLAVIAQSVEPIRRALPPGETPARRSLQLIERSVARLDGLVTAQRDLDVDTADLFYPERRPLNLSMFLRQMLENYDASLAAQGRRLFRRIEPNVLVYANEDALETVIENLLENALSFTAPGGTVEVRLYAEGNRVKLAVLDEGPGVSAGDMHHLFERGFSNRSASLDEGELSVRHQGLGLWIVKRNVEALGGTVSARNRASAGFEVVVRLKGEG
jgi:two-component system sensor histidine kinase ChvG